MACGRRVVSVVLACLRLGPLIAHCVDRRLRIHWRGVFTLTVPTIARRRSRGYDTTMRSSSSNTSRQQPLMTTGNGERQHQSALRLNPSSEKRAGATNGAISVDKRSHFRGSCSKPAAQSIQPAQFSLFDASISIGAIGSVPAGRHISRTSRSMA